MVKQGNNNSPMLCESAPQQVPIYIKRRTNPKPTAQKDNMSISTPPSTSAGGNTRAESEPKPLTSGKTIPKLPYPELVDRTSYVWPYVYGIGIYHLLALLAFMPWFFSWTGLAACLLGIYCFGTLGINLTYHRILTHQGVVLPKWLERTFAILGVCCMQDTPARWVAIHRLHHLHSDEQGDPHSPLVTLFWGHCGWLFLRNRQMDSVATYERYARDVLRDPVYLWLERNWAMLWINVAQSFVYAIVGTGIGFLLFDKPLAAVQFGLSVWLWGVIVRTVLVWHITWSVNSLSHIWGYQNYDTKDNSRNNWFVAWISNGEGWHNNHHADQRAAVHGHRWWEFDVTWRTIRALEFLGIAKNIVRPREH